ncbi:MAG: ATP-grasp domain-containing protein [bacterium]
MPDNRVLVIGTTPDYIYHIDNNFPGRAIFVTDKIHQGAFEELPLNDNSIFFCHLSNTSEVYNSIDSHLKRWDQTASGIVCFDCEWLDLTSVLAEMYKLPYSSRETVKYCRNKFYSKKKWLEKGIRCPDNELIENEHQAYKFFERVNGPIVLKPLSGTGSELTFRCDDKPGVENAYHMIRDGLKQRSKSHLYQKNILNPEDSIIPSEIILGEEFIEGCEYSCDFILDNSEIKIIRIAKKCQLPDMPFGTSIGYLVPARLPGWIDDSFFNNILKEACEALGIIRSICNVDLMITGNEIVFIEITPRPGGDFIPLLIKKCCGLDLLELALDFAEGKNISIPPPEKWKNLAGLRLFADQQGIIKSIDITALEKDSCVLDVIIIRKPGEAVFLPPEDYDTWLLGYLIFEPNDESLEYQCVELRKKLTIYLDLYDGQKSARDRSQGSGTVKSADTKTW